jgi:hypothetical protein
MDSFKASLSCLPEQRCRDSPYITQHTVYDIPFMTRVYQLLHVLARKCHLQESFEQRYIGQSTNQGSIT